MRWQRCSTTGPFLTICGTASPFPTPCATRKRSSPPCCPADREKTFACAIVENDVVIGSIALYRGANVHFRTAELGYYLGRAFWGRGYAL